MMQLHRQGSGSPLLLVHGLGASRHSWAPVLPALTATREVIGFDLPGHGETPAEGDSGTFAGLMRSFAAMLDEHGLAGVDMVGSSLGARIVLEAFRRGRSGAVVALDPGGFWEGWERAFFKSSLYTSIAMLRLARSMLPWVARTTMMRTVVMAQLSARPWALPSDLIERELKGYVATRTFNALVHDLGDGPAQEGRRGGRVAIGWGRHDRLCLPQQAERATTAFPDARLEWFEHSGHFPAWDEAERAAAFILANTG